MKDLFYYYDTTYALLHKFYNLRDVQILTERSKPQKRIDYYIISKGIVGSIVCKQNGGVDIYEEELFLAELNKYDWELFKPYPETVEYEHLLRTDFLNQYITENKQNLSDKYTSLIKQWNRKLWTNLDLFIKEINDFGVKDSFYFRINPYKWTEQFLCKVSYNQQENKLIYSIVGQNA